MEPTIEEVATKLPDLILDECKHHSALQHLDTASVVMTALKTQFPDWVLSVHSALECDLVQFAKAGNAKLEEIDPQNTRSIMVMDRPYRHPQDRDLSDAKVQERILFGRYSCKWKEEQFLIYVIEGGDCRCYSTNYYILHRPMLDCPDGIRNKPALDLMKTVATWTLDVHDEVWMFDAGNWSKSKELWENVQKTSWSGVILEEGLRESLIQDTSGFFDAKRMYERLSVPWKVSRFECLQYLL
jgi:transitional endoplasmic reticulum ATPase